MNFAIYLSEAADEQISVDDFIESIKEKGLYGYDVLKHFTEDELRSKITDDAHFKSGGSKPIEVKDESKEKDSAKDDKEKDDKKKDKIEEMVLRGKPTDNKEEQETPKEKELSLAVRLGLKKKFGKDDPQASSSDNLNTKYTFGKKPEEQEKPKPQTFADKMREYAEQKRKEQQERAAKEKELRDQRAKEVMDRHKEDEAEKPEITFNGKTQSKQSKEDEKKVDRTLSDIEKELEKEMFKKTRASTKVDTDGYKSVKNFSRVSDAEAERKLAREMEKKFPSKEVQDKKKAKLGNSDQAVEKEAHVMARNEYSKRTLTALAEKVPDFTIYCKYRKLNGDIRTGEFTLLGRDSQVTQKVDTLVVVDNNLSKKENKRVYRTINLFKILEIKPL